MKWSLTLGAVFCMTGAGMMTAGAVMGGAGDVEYQLRQSIGEESIRSELSYDFEARKSKGADAVTGATQKSRVQQNVQNQITGNVGDPQNGIYQNVMELEIEASAGTVTVKQEKRENPQDTAIYVERSSSGRANERAYMIRMERDTLKIEAPDGAVMENLAIRVPEGYTFREVDVEAWQSNVSFDAIRANKVSLDAKGGEIKSAYTTAEELNVDCAAGVVTLNVDGNTNQFNYEMDNRYGTISLGGNNPTVYKEYMDERYLNNGARKKAELDCESGTITLKFLNEA